MLRGLLKPGKSVLNKLQKELCEFEVCLEVRNVTSLENHPYNIFDPILNLTVVSDRLIGIIEKTDQLLNVG